MYFYEFALNMHYHHLDTTICQFCCDCKQLQWIVWWNCSHYTLYIVFIIIGFDVLFLIGVYQLKLVLFTVILDMVLSHTIYFIYYCDIYYTSNILINCIVIGFNHGECTSYYSSLIYSIMIFIQYIVKINILWYNLMD